MFQVVWSEHSLDDLADVWVAADPSIRDRIEAAVNRLNYELRDYPDEFGESRDRDRRIGFAEPLVVIFRINRTNAKVRIDHVWRREKR